MAISLALTALEVAGAIYLGAARLFDLPPFRKLRMLKDGQRQELNIIIDNSGMDNDDTVTTPTM